uniref:Uncharacterized protein n=1 Tax=Anguilla anguilla TaxID=7936 RepID=A0A0E9WDN1_ANGAN
MCEAAAAAPCVMNGCRYDVMFVTLSCSVQSGCCCVSVTRTPALEHGDRPACRSLALVC